MSIKLTILGSGTCVPRLDRRSCALLVETGKAKIVMDLGPGTIHRLLECGVSIFDLTHIFLSHFHPDHTSELVPLLFATKYPDGQRRRHQLHIMGGVGLTDFYHALRGAYENWIVLPETQCRLQEIDTQTGETLLFDDFKIIARPVDHRPESLAYRIEDRIGHSMVYSGDTDHCAALSHLAFETDLLICESAMPDEHKAPGHLTPSLAGAIANQARAKQLVLTHLYPECDKVDVVKQAASAYKGKVVAAQDLMVFELG